MGAITAKSSKELLHGFLCLPAQTSQKLSVGFCLAQALHNPLRNIADIIRIRAYHSHHASQQLYLFQGICVQKQLFPPGA